ncbi:MAG: hypothetical protein H8E66_18335 [Planctomycetes bacterium]|nr:hypothetical protein [Planctomycetota bacterium]
MRSFHRSNRKRYRKGNRTRLRRLAVETLEPRRLLASLPALIFSEVGETRTSGCDISLGWEFHVDHPVVVDGLGFWDETENSGRGLIEGSHEVSLWRVGVSDVTLITRNSASAAASFTIKVEMPGTSTATTSAIPFGATSAQVQSSLAALSNVGQNADSADNVRVTGNAGGPWMVEFVNDLGSTSVDLTKGAGSSLEDVFFQDIYDGGSVNHSQSLSSVTVTDNSTVVGNAGVGQWLFEDTPNNVVLLPSETYALSAYWSWKFDTPTDVFTNFVTSSDVLPADGVTHIGGRVHPHPTGTACGIDIEGHRYPNVVLPERQEAQVFGPNVRIRELGVGSDLDPEVTASFSTDVVPRQWAEVEIELQNPDPVSNRLDAWIDFNGDGDFQDFRERILFNEDIGQTSETQTFSFNIPSDAPLGTTGSRFHVSKTGVSGSVFPSDLPPERVQGFTVEIEAKPREYGDAPDGSAGTGFFNYRTVEADNGPSHPANSNVFMGALTGDLEPINALVHPIAFGDDNEGIDDEDGVVDSFYIQTLLVGQSPNVRVNVTNNSDSPATLYGWIDYNQNGDFENEGERASVPVPAGTVNEEVTLSFPPVPTLAGDFGNTFSRFRISTDSAAANSFGRASDGEVEDHPTSILVSPTLDYGDAPDFGPGTSTLNYDTLLEENGARHGVWQDLYMGSGPPDTEADGQPTFQANGDAAGTDDDDGVNLADLQLTLGQTSEVRVTVFNASRIEAALAGWIDYNGDGVFDNDTEMAIAAVPNGTDGEVQLSFPEVPQNAVRTTYARFRLGTTNSPAMPTGGVFGGEVEDYLVTVSDANTAVVAFYLPPAGSTEVSIDGDDIVASSASMELLRAGGGGTSLLGFHGTSGDDTLNIANLGAIFAGKLGFNGGSGHDALVLTGGSQGLDLTNIDSLDLHSVEVIDILGNGANSLILTGQSVLGISETAATLRIHHGEDDTLDYVGNWTVQPPNLVDGQYVHVLTQAGATIEVANTIAWRNPFNALDPNRDGHTAPVDALVIINTLNEMGARPLATPELLSALPAFYYDTSGDLSVSPLDALLIINFLNGDGSKEGEGGITALFTVAPTNSPETSSDGSHLPELLRSRLVDVTAYALRDMTEQTDDARQVALETSENEDWLSLPVDEETLELLATELALA